MSWIRESYQNHSHVQCCLQLSRIPQIVQDIPLSLGSTWDPKGHPPKTVTYCMENQPK